MDARDRAALRCSTTIVGAVSLLTVVLLAASYALAQYVVLPGSVGPPDGTTVGTFLRAHDLAWLFSKRVAPLLVVCAGTYLTAIRGLPVAPCLAGAFLGGLVAAIGHPLVVGAIPGQLSFLHVELLREFLRWTVRIVVPAMAAVLLGAVLGQLRGRAVGALGVGG